MPSCTCAILLFSNIQPNYGAKTLTILFFIAHISTQDYDVKINGKEGQTDTANADPATTTTTSTTAAADVDG